MKVKHLVVVVMGMLLVLMASAAYADPPQPMDLIINEVNAAVCGHDYSNASATLQKKEQHGTTKVTIKVKGAKPNHLHTVWYKLDGASPLSGIGATPAAPTSEIDNIIASAGTAAAEANGFYTNSAGNGTLHIRLDFLFSNGVYPFSQYDPNEADVPTDDTPFTFRVISHCTDDVQHGLYPGTHEPTFQISLPL